MLGIIWIDRMISTCMNGAIEVEYRADALYIISLMEFGS